MSGKAYGKTIPFGFRGAVSRQPDTLVMPFTNIGEDNIQFGEPVVYDATTKGVRKIKSGDNSADIIGLAVRRMGQPYADDNQGWYYKKGDTVDVLVRGSMTVELKTATGIAARGKVYVDPADGGVTSVSTNMIEVPNAVFATGDYDSNNIAEVTILTRSI